MSRKFDFKIVTFSRDQIEQMSADEIQKEIFKLKRIIKEAVIQGKDTTRYEIEYCYLDHERQLRFGYEQRPRKKRIGGHY
jgi:hypothetical protein